MASLTICHNNSSGTSGVANGFTTRKQTSVNGSARNSSSSSGERRAISAGMYNPRSGASPRNTAPRSEVSGAFPPVLRYLIGHHFPLAPPTPKTLPLYGAIPAAPPPATSHAPPPHNSASPLGSNSDTTAPLARADALPPSPE